MRSSHHHLSTFYHSQVVYCSPNCEFGGVGTEDGMFVKLEGSVIRWLSNSAKLAIRYPIGTPLSRAQSIHGGKKRPYRQMAEQNMIKLLIDFCALCSKTDIQQGEKIKTKRKKMHRLNLLKIASATSPLSHSLAFTGLQKILFLHLNISTSSSSHKKQSLISLGSVGKYFLMRWGLSTDKEREEFMRNR